MNYHGVTGLPYTRWSPDEMCALLLIKQLIVCTGVFLPFMQSEKLDVSITLFTWVVDAYKSA